MAMKRWPSIIMLLYVEEITNHSYDAVERLLEEIGAYKNNFTPDATVSGVSPFEMLGAE